MNTARPGNTHAPASALLLALALLLTGPAARSAAGADADAALRALAATKDEQERVAHIRRLAKIDGAQIVATLARLARSDPSTAVRIAAVTAVGTSRASKAESLLLQVLLYGGPLPLREATAKALRTRPGGGAAAVALLRRRSVTRLGQGLVIAALGYLRDPKSLSVLTTFATYRASPLRGEAIRALGRRRDEQGERLRTLVGLLRDDRDSEVLLSALEAAEGLPNPVLLPLAKRLSSAGTNAVRAAAKHLLRHIEEQRKVTDAKAAAQPDSAGKKEEDRYARPEPTPDKTPPPPPGPRKRFDLVYLLDVTGSAHDSLPRVCARILREARRTKAPDSSVRVGVIAYRGQRSARRAVQILPLTYDLARLPAFLGELRASGSDDRGAAIGTALHRALDQMDWRRRAHRRVYLFADAGISNARRAKAVVDLHYRTDGTHTHVAYYLRTRSKVPPELAALARLGGTTRVQQIR